VDITVAKMTVSTPAAAMQTVATIAAKMIVSIKIATIKTVVKRIRMMIRMIRMIRIGINQEPLLQMLKALLPPLQPLS
jgi:hypothetical protein